MHVSKTLACYPIYATNSWQLAGLGARLWYPLIMCVDYLRAVIVLRNIKNCQLPIHLSPPHTRAIHIDKYRKEKSMTRPRVSLNYCSRHRLVHPRGTSNCALHISTVPHHTPGTEYDYVLPHTKDNINHCRSTRATYLQKERFEIAQPSQSKREIIIMSATRFRCRALLLRSAILGV